MANGYYFRDSQGRLRYVPESNYERGRNAKHKLDNKKKKEEKARQAKIVSSDEKEALRSKINNNMTKLQEEADKRGILPSELQDQLGISDEDLGFEDEYAKNFENEMQGMQRYLKADEAKRTFSKEEMAKANNIPIEKYDETIMRSPKGEVIKDERYYDWVEKTDPNTDLSDKELEDIYKSTYPDRIKTAGNEEAMNYMQDQFKAFDKGEISGADLEKSKKDSGLSKKEIENARNYVNDRAPKGYDRITENKSGNTTSQAVPGEKQNAERDTFKKIAKFYGYDKLSNDEIIKNLNAAEQTGMYHSKDEIAAMKNYLDRTLVEKDTGSAYSNPGKRWEVLEEGKSAYGDKIYKVRDEDDNVQWKSASSFYEKGNQENVKQAQQELKNQIGATSFNRWQKAYNEYKKEHKGTKLTLYDFIKMNYN